MIMKDKYQAYIAIGLWVGAMIWFLIWIFTKL